MSRSILTKEMYEVRWKLFHDEQGRLRRAYEEGFAKGLAEARQETLLQGRIKIVQTLQEILSVATTSQEGLAALGAEGLDMIINELMTRVEERSR